MIGDPINPGRCVECGRESSVRGRSDRCPACLDADPNTVPEAEVVGRLGGLDATLNSEDPTVRREFARVVQRLALGPRRTPRRESRRGTGKVGRVEDREGRLRDAIERVYLEGRRVTQAEVADRLGIDERTLRDALAKEPKIDWSAFVFQTEAELDRKHRR